MEHDELGKIYSHLPVLVEIRDAEEGLLQRDLRDRLGQSKSTVHRKVKWLEDQGLVERDDTYTVSQLGAVVTRKFESCAEEVEAAAEFVEFLDVVESTDLRIEDIRGGRVTRASEDNPFQPMTRLGELAVGVEDARVLTGSMAPQGFSVGRRGVRTGEMTLDLVVDTDIVDTVDVSGWYGEGLEEDLDSGNLEIWVHQDVPHRIGVLDDELVLGTEDENGMPDALLETGEPSAVEWAHDEIDRYIEEARQLTTEDL